MKIWRIVSGIISIVVFIIIIFQSCATSIVNVLDDNTSDTSAGAGIWVAFVLLTAGIVSTSLSKNTSRGADIALMLIFGLAALIGFTNLGTFGDLEVWSWWSAICAFVSFLTMWIPKKDKTEQVTK